MTPLWTADYHDSGHTTKLIQDNSINDGYLHSMDGYSLLCSDKRVLALQQAIFRVAGNKPSGRSCNSCNLWCLTRPLSQETYFMLKSLFIICNHYNFKTKHCSQQGLFTSLFQNTMLRFSLSKGYSISVLQDAYCCVDTD